MTTLETRTQAPAALTGQPKWMSWAGWILSGLLGVFMLFDGVMKIILPDAILKATQEFGFPTEPIRPLGVICTVAAILYLIPRTAVLGAILLTAYLGGAVCAHVMKSDGQWFFAVVFGVVAWLGLVIRDRRVRALTPIAAD